MKKKYFVLKIVKYVKIMIVNNVLMVILLLKEFVYLKINQWFNILDWIFMKKIIKNKSVIKKIYFVINNN